MTYILVKTVTTVVTTSFGFYNICLYLGGFSQHVASLYTEMLLLELIPGATRPSTEINNNYFFYSTSTMIIYDRFSL